MRFVKMQGAGNDYIYVDCLREPIPGDPAAVSRKVSDRHFGIGADGLVLICPPDEAGHDAKMRMFNADGSEAQMCGNAIRCVAKYLYEKKIADKDRLIIETGRGPLNIELETRNGSMERARVNMMAPILEAKRIPTTLPGDPPVNAKLEVGGKVVAATCVSMGNPHCVVFVDAVTDDWVLGIGPQLENHPAFPERANVEFVQVVSPSEVRMRVWERGSGETLACGTGACAACVAGVVSGRTGRRVRAQVRGGMLDLEWSATDNCVYMSGPAEWVFSGEIDV